MDSTQAINLVLLLKNNQDEITKKLRQNFLEFSLDDTINNEKKAVKYRLSRKKHFGRNKRIKRVSVLY